MDTASAWSLILGVISPVLISVINRPSWTSQQKRIMAIVFAVLVGVVNLIVQGQLGNLSWSFHAILINVVLVAGAAQVAYATLWKPTGLSDSVEARTSPSEAPGSSGARTTVPDGTTTPNNQV